MDMEQTLKKVLLALLLIAVAVLSATVLADRFSSPALYDSVTQSIDGKAETVLKLTGTATAASAGISALPSDTATPIAGKLADFAEYFLLILCVLYTEKYLLTITALAAFRFLIPLACLLLAVSLFRYPRVLQRLAVKVIAVGLALFLLVPCSIRLADLIYNTFQESINYTISSAEELSDETLALTEAGEDQNVIQKILGTFSDTAGNIMDRAVDIVNRFVETIAVLIVTSCIIPVITLIFFIWLIKAITGVNLREAIPERFPGARRRPKNDENK